MSLLLRILFLSNIFFLIRKSIATNIFSLPFSSGWAKWSDFSSCSTECGTGLQYQLRRCLDIHCSGPNKRYRLCNENKYEKRCRSREKLKEIETCEFINQKDGRYEYIGADEIENDCEIRCKSIFSGIKTKTNQSKVDGTLCYYGNLKKKGVCIDGKCHSIGCDNIVNSTAKIDDCGRCVTSIHETPCTKNLTAGIFEWSDSQQFSSCDKSCGPERYRISISICINTKNNKTVPERFCANIPKPQPIVEKCSYIVCPEKWIKSKWSSCTTTCGDGIQSRNVYCVETHNETLTPNIPSMFRFKRSDNSDVDYNELEMTNRKVEDKFCWQTMKPKNIKSCNLGECPEWKVGDWGICSVTCENGYKFRNVDCYSGNKKVDENYCREIKPRKSIQCYTGLKCTNKHLRQLSPIKYPPKISLPTEDTYLPWKVSKFGYQNDDSASFSRDNNKDESSENYINYLTNYEEPHYEAGEWSSCSVTCGSGIKIRTVECVSSRGIGRGTIKLRDYECEGQKKPEEYENCDEIPCPLKDDSLSFASYNNNTTSSIQLLSNNFKTTYRWDYGEWSNCINGREKSNLKCIDIIRKVPVSWKYCDPKQRPIDRTRSCQNNNDISNEEEIGEWETLPWSECSTYCGGGIKTRKVRCIKKMESNEIPEEKVILDDSKCNDMKPSIEEVCGNIDCEAKWKTEPWSECSTTCGPGEQRRYVVCQQITLQGKLRIFDSYSPCDSLTKPPTVQLCNYGPCDKMLNEDTIFPQHFLQKSLGPSYDAREDHHKKLTLNVGGYANLYEGTSLKIKCPVKNFDKSKIIWRKNGKNIVNTNHIKVSNNGALRIFHAKMSDAGIYSCIGNGIQGNVTLAFKHKSEGRKSRGGGHHGGGKYNENDPDKQLLQIVRTNLKKIGDDVFYQKISHLREPGKIKADFSIGNWSSCSLVECNIGEEGTQVRAVKCQISYKNLTAYVDDIVCEQFGVVKVPSSRSCKPEECPFWDAEKWSECLESRCIHQGTAVQKRNVRCLFANLTIADTKYCDRAGRPKVKRECVNKKCVAEWKPSEWGVCSKSCGNDGIQMRILKCVWYGTKKPAGRQCTNIERPSAVRNCNTHISCPLKTKGEENIPEPFKGWQKWRGWHLYKWDPDALDKKRF